MDAVIKVGGSLARESQTLRKLCGTLSKLSKKHKIVVVPGGGEFADLVREMDKRYSLNPTTAHKMAILCTDQYGYLLSELLPDSHVARTFSEAEKTAERNAAAVLLPSELLLQETSLDASWDVTSDSVAAFIADKLQAQKLILITNVDGLLTSHPADEASSGLIERIAASQLLKYDQRTCVDKYLPKLLLKARFSTYIVNGNHPVRVGKILANGQTICTEILNR
jgi:hypothetical protein